jgi:hypothetical protein
VAAPDAWAFLGGGGGRSTRWARWRWATAAELGWRGVARWAAKAGPRRERGWRGRARALGRARGEAAGAHWELGRAALARWAAVAGRLGRARAGPRGGRLAWAERGGREGGGGG